MNPRQRIEITHDILAREVYARIDADEKMRLKVTQFLKDRYDYYTEAGVQLTKEDLEYVGPYLGVVDLTPEQQTFVAESRRDAVARARRRALLIGAVILLLLGAAAVSTFLGIRATRSEHRTALALEESDSLRRVAELEKRTALSEKERADRALGRALAADSATRVALSESERQRGIALTERGRAELEARVARSSALSAQARAAYANDHTQALNLALAAEAYESTPESRQVLSDILLDENTLLYRSTRLERPDQMMSLALDPSGQYVLAGYSDGTLWLASAETGRLIHELPGHRMQIFKTAFSPDGRFALSASFDNDARIWDTATGEERGVFIGHSGPVLDLAVSPDGTQLLTASIDKTVRLWDIATQREIRRMIGHDAGVICAAFHPDGSTAVSGAESTEVIRWDLTTGEVLQTYAHDEAEAIVSLTFAPSGTVFFTADDVGVIQGWHTESGRRTESYRGHEGIVTRMYCPYDAALFSVGTDGTARAWEVVSGQEKRRLLGHDSIVTDIRVLPTGEALTVGLQGVVRRWSQVGAETLRSFEHDQVIRAVVFIAAGRQMLTCSYDGAVKIWETETGRLLREFAIPEGPQVAAFALAPDERSFVVGYHRNLAIHYDLASLQEIRRFTDFETQVSALAISPDGRHLLMGNYDGAVRRWDLTTGRMLEHYGSRASPVNDVAFSPDGRYVAIAATAGDSRLYSVGNPARGIPLDAGLSIYDLAFSGRGDRLVAGSMEHEVLIYDVPSGRRRLTIRDPSTRIKVVAFSPDGRHVFTSGSNYPPNSNLREANYGTIFERLTGMNQTLSTACFSPDGLYLAAGDVGGKVWLWRDFFAEWRSGKLWDRIDRLSSEEQAAYGIDWEY